ncbi:hypothetical protein [Cytobacillus firmus]|uniref:hypothetical protein n=1 Tax=Cytobacillus firmus TaxID=1399 RepID=UPI0018CD7A77|nr:hypothetical protein [Cytobacillus firmus]
MKYVDIFKKSLADELKKRGHVPVKIRANYKNPKYEVFIFENTAEFNKSMGELNRVFAR